MMLRPLLEAGRAVNSHVCVADAGSTPLYLHPANNTAEDLIQLGLLTSGDCYETERRLKLEEDVEVVFLLQHQGGCSSLPPERRL